MKRTFSKLIIILSVAMSFPLWNPLMDNLTSHLQDKTIHYLKYNLKVLPLTQVESSTLKIADTEPLRIGGVNLGDVRERVDFIHQAQTSSINEYGLNWTTYHRAYQSFMMVMYDTNNVAKGLFTNQDIADLPYGIRINTPKQEVRSKLGEPLTYIEKGNTHFLIDSKEEYDVYLLRNQFVTIFYDLHQNNVVTAVQMIDYDTELSFNALYAKGSEALSYALEEQLFDLTNATRVKYNLPILTWSQAAADTAYRHSRDMAENNYFNHIDLKGRSPFDRLNQDGISYALAAENLAFGQKSSIFAHQGLFNSQGHRTNILLDEVSQLGTGVSFDDKDQPYYTAIFYSEK